jgi:hypothetical protein
MIVEATRTSKPSQTSLIVRRPDPRHSWRNKPHSVLKMMIEAIWSVQLEKEYAPIFVSPML